MGEKEESERGRGRKLGGEKEERGLEEAEEK